MCTTYIVRRTMYNVYCVQPCMQCTTYIAHLDTYTYIRNTSHNKTYPRNSQEQSDNVQQYVVRQNVNNMSCTPYNILYTVHCTLCTLHNNVHNVHNCCHISN